MSTISVSTARGDLPAVIASASEEAVHLQRRGRTVAVLLSPERYEALLEAWEEIEDTAAYDDATADTDPRIPWDQVKIDLGWT